MPMLHLLELPVILAVIKFDYSMFILLYLFYPNCRPLRLHIQNIEKSKRSSSPC